jgi:hypothetical protein
MRQGTNVSVFRSSLLDVTAQKTTTWIFLAVTKISHVVSTSLCQSSQERVVSKLQCSKKYVQSSGNHVASKLQCPEIHVKFTGPRNIQLTALRNTWVVHRLCRDWEGVTVRLESTEILSSAQRLLIWRSVTNRIVKELTFAYTELTNEAALEFVLQDLETLRLPN